MAIITIPAVAAAPVVRPLLLEESFFRRRHLPDRPSLYRPCMNMDCFEPSDLKAPSSKNSDSSNSLAIMLELYHGKNGITIIKLYQEVEHAYMPSHFFSSTK